MLQLPPTEKSLRSHLEFWSLNVVNEKLSRMSLPCLSPLEKFSRQPYVMEHIGCSPLAQFRLCSASLGNRIPRPGHSKESVCSLCARKLDECHVTISCQDLRLVRRGTSVQSFLIQCRVKRIPDRKTYTMFVNGLDSDGKEVATSVHLQRGDELMMLKQHYLRLAG